MKTLDDYFIDWEGHVFGYGYGSGEEHIIPTLQLFMAAVPASGNYDYRVLEETCGHVIAWLLINTLCHADIIDYGSSPRFGWLTAHGKTLKEYLGSHEATFLVDSATDFEGHTPCYPTHCNCDDERCHNPFWPEEGK